MRSTIEWFEKGYHKIEEKEDTAKRVLLFIMDKEYLKGAQEPLEALKKYLAVKEKKEEDQDLFF